MGMAMGTEVCPTCHHSVTGRRGSCGYCRKRHRSFPCSNPECDYCARETLASSEIAQTEWGDKNNLAPREIWKTCATKVWLQCSSCKILRHVPANRVDRHGCNLCSHKTEKKLYDALMIMNIGIVQHQAIFEWSGSQRFDFYIREIDSVVELDGPQHFCPVRTWKSGFEIYESDLRKETLAIENGLSVVRLLQEDVWNDRNDWRSFLTSTISSIRESASQPRVYHPRASQYTSGPYKRLRTLDFFF